MKLTQEQNTIITNTLKFIQDSSDKFICILGHSGTGKTILIKHIINAINQMQNIKNSLRFNFRNYNIQITATTNTATALLNEILPEYNATTIHKFLGLKIKNDYIKGTQSLITTEYTTIKNNYIIIIDEASMLNNITMKYLIDLTQNCKIILIGDPYQLAPVKQAKVIFNTLICKKYKLTQIHRNKGSITKAAALYRHTVNNKIFSALLETDQITFLSGSKFKKTMKYYFTKPTNLTTKILTWTNQKVLAYNSFIRQIKRLPEEFTTGEIVITNNTIRALPYHKCSESTVIITDTINTIYRKFNIPTYYIELDNTYHGYMFKHYFHQNQVLKFYKKNKNWSKYFEIKDNYLDLRSPYASTVFKAQGHEYDIVFINLEDIGKCNISDTVARMLYVAISRAKQHVYLYGQLPLKYQGK